jgi:hypothetical protein
MKLLDTARLVVVTAAMALSTMGSFAHADPATDPTGDAPLSTATVTAQADYWEAAEPHARTVKAEYDIPASVAAAQAAHESAYGASSLAAQYNNHFGMKCVTATDPGPIAIGCRNFPTEECQPTCGPTTAYFRVYASMTDSFRDYGRLLTTSSYYAHALPYRHDPREFIRRVAERYATDPSYATKIIAMMDANNLYRFDVGGDPARQAYPMYHQVRNADTTWTGFAPLAGHGTTLPGDAKDVAVAAMADGTAQVVVVGADDVVYHQIRYPDRWTGFQPLAGHDTAVPAKAKSVSIAGLVDGSAQIVIVGWDDRIYHQTRHPDRWTGFQPVAGMGTTTPAAGKDVAIAALPDGSTQLVIVGADDGLYHRIRGVDGAWGGFQPLAGNGTTTAAKGKRVSSAGTADGSAQLVIVGWDDRIYHQVRNADGAWTGFEPLNGMDTTTPAAGKDVAIGAHPDGTAQVLIVGSDDGMYHRVRSGTSWTPFRALAGTDGATAAKGSRVAISGHSDNSAQIVVTGR